MKKIIESIYYRSPNWAQNIFVSMYGYHLYQKRYTGIYYDIQAEIKSVAKMSSSQIDSLQSEKLHQMIVYCNNEIPYYKKLFSDYGISPKDITDVTHLKKIPILDKAEVKRKPELFRPKTKKRPWITQHTSGSTGSPLTLEVDEYTYKLAMALLVDHEEQAGVFFKKPRATFAGRIIQPIDNYRAPFYRFNRAENQSLFSSYHLRKDTFNQYRKDLDKIKPLEIIGYPSSISFLASLYQYFGCQPNFRPEAIITNSESLLDWQREKIESVFHCQVYDYYGTAEYVVFASQSRDGIYRTNPLIGVTELISEEMSNLEHQIIATTLCNKAMPLIRYNVGDSATPLTESNTPIGAPHLTKINGRIDDYIETIDGRKIGRIDHIFKGLKGIREAQVVQTGIECCLIKLVREPNEFFDETILIQNLEYRISKKMKYEIKIVDKIPRGKNGKFKSVIRDFIN